MARQQVQLPGIIQPTPQARPVDTFVQSKLNSPVPKEILDLSKFSSALAEWVGTAVAESRQRSLAQGEADVNLGRAYGSGLVQTKEGEQSRKDFAEAQKRGEILASEDPWYRIGVFSAEGRRVGQTIEDELLSDKTLREMSQVVDDKGNFAPPADNIDAEFDRRIQPYLTAPALQTIYGQRVASDLLKDTRTKFHIAVSQYRDKAIQQYHGDEIVRQISKNLTNAHEIHSVDPMKGIEAKRGFEDMTDEILRQGNVPEPRKFIRLAMMNFVDMAAQDKSLGPDEAIARLDYILTLPIGRGVTVESDGSVDGMAFRDEIAKERARQLEAQDRAEDRKYRETARNRASAVEQANADISSIFAAAPTPEAGRKEAEDYVNRAVDPAYRTDAIVKVTEQYNALSRPVELSPRQINQIQEIILTKGTDAAEEAIGYLKATGEIDAIGQNKLMQSVNEARSAWADLPQVKEAFNAFKVRGDSMATGLSEDASSSVRNEVAKIDREMRAEIRKAASGPQVDPGKRDAAISAIIDNANQKLADMDRARREQEKAFDTERQTSWGTGASFREKLGWAYEAGVINDDKFNSYLEQDAKKTSAEDFVSAASGRVSLLVQMGRSDTFGGPSATQVAESLYKAEAKAREWFNTERKNYKTPEEARAAFGTWLQDTLTPELQKGLEGATKEQGEAADSAKKFREDLRDKRIIQKKADRVRSYYTATNRDSKSTVDRFLDRWGDAKGIDSIRKEARGTLSAAAVKADLDTAGFKELARTGFLSFSELESQTFNPVVVWSNARLPQRRVAGPQSFGTADIDIWMTPVAATSVDFNSRQEKDPESLRRLATLYKVPEAKYDEWLMHQAVLINSIEGN